MVINNVSSQDIAKATSTTCGNIEEKEYRDNLENEDFNEKYAVTMEISKEGYKKAQKLIEQTDIPKGATEMSCNNCKTRQNLLDTVKNGGSLSKEEKEYKNSTYYQITQHSYSSVKDDLGKYGEYLTYKYLKIFEVDGAKFLFNVYIPKEEE